MKNKLNNLKNLELQDLLENFLDDLSEIDSNITNGDVLKLVRDLSDFILHNTASDPKDLDIVEIDGVLKYRKDLETPFEDYTLIQEEKYIEPIEKISTNTMVEVFQSATEEALKAFDINLEPLPTNAFETESTSREIAIIDLPPIVYNFSQTKELVVTDEAIHCEILPDDISSGPILDKEILILTEHQQQRFDAVTKRIQDILVRSNSVYRVNTNGDSVINYMSVLEGAAGTGKTTMMTKILEWFSDNGLSVCFCSPTHQALGVIRETLKKYELDFCESVQEMQTRNTNLIIKTLASFLGIKMKRDLENGQESFVEDKRAEKITVDVLCIDESSMVSKDQLAIICAKLHICVKVILFIGDEIQLPSPSDKEPNKIFTLPLNVKFSLEEIVRQAADNKLLPLAWELRGYILNKQYPYKPSVLLHDGRMNENIIIYRNNQPGFIYHYGADVSKNKLISTYTNKICNEYNNYIRWEKLIGNCGGMDESIKINKTLRLTEKINDAPVMISYNDLVTDNGEAERNKIYTNEEFREYYIGEKLIMLETNQSNGDVLHQNGEVISILSVCERVHSIYIESNQGKDMFDTSTLEEYKLEYYEILDTNFKKVNVIKFNQMENYHNIINLLSIETNKSSGKNKWKKFYDFKEKFTKVNYLFAATLYKLQGSTCENLYLDARDLDRFYSWNPDIVYRLIYVALTRPKNNIIILI